MGIDKFTALLQNQVYRDWVKKLDNTIATKTATQLRSKQLTAQRTRFYLTESKLLEVLQTIGGKDLKIEKSELQLMMREIATGGIVNLTQQEAELEKIPYGIQTNINGENAIKFDSISYDLISKRLQQVLNKNDSIQQAFKKAEENFEEQELAALKNNPKYKASSTSDKRKLENNIKEKAKERKELGFYFNKGHVISVATNLARQFKRQVEQANNLADEQRNLLVNILDLYADKLIKEDLETANLPEAIYHQMWANYEKDPDTYIVELQIKAKNLSSGSLSRTTYDELRNILSPSITEKDLRDIIKENKFLESLVTTSGSLSFLDMQAKRIADALTNKKSTIRPSKSPAVKVGEKKTKINKPKSNSSKAATIKKLKSKLEQTKAKTNLVKNLPEASFIETESIIPRLQRLLNASLIETVKQNMGTGDRRDILNLRSGRFAESVEVPKISESRQGMITAFYTYMKNPYSTFSQGGRQQYPRSRDPKLLISKSIRQLAEQLAIKRLRAVQV